MMRNVMMVSLAALLLSGCGGEKYPVPASRAFETLTSVGTTNITPLPGGLNPVSVSFEALPAENAVRWAFSHDGDDLAHIIARVTPDGESASKVTVDYVEGTAPDENWRNGQVRGLIQGGVQQLVMEAVDSRMENRSFDAELAEGIRMGMVQASVGGMMTDAGEAMDAAMEKQEQAAKEREARSASNPYAATRPSTDLSKFNSNSR